MDTINSIIQFNETIIPPDPIQYFEKDGVVFKVYNFLTAHPSFPLMFNDNSTTDYLDSDFGRLTVYKNEIEKQLDINSQFCFTSLKSVIDHAKSEIYNMFLESSEQSKDKLIKDLKNVNALFHNFFNGLYFGINYDELMYTYIMDLSGNKEIWRVGKLFVFVLDDSREELEPIHRIISNSLGLYKNYLKMHSWIFKIDMFNTIPSRISIPTLVPWRRVKEIKDSLKCSTKEARLEYNERVGYDHFKSDASYYAAASRATSQDEVKEVTMRPTIIIPY